MRSSSATSIGVAVVGTGFIGPVHVEALRRLGHRVVGLLGSSAEKSRAAADALGIPKGYATFAELLADGEVASVHLASPNRLHFEQCKLALAAGKHVVCEKPLAMTAAETGELVRLAATTDRIAAVNYNCRFYPSILELRARVQAGSFGRILHIGGSYQQDWLLHDTDYNWRVDATEGGELRAVADIGTHWLDTAGFVLGDEPAEVLADLHTVHSIRHRPTGPTETFTGSSGGDRPTVPVPIATDDYGALLLHYRSGTRGAVQISQVSAGRKNSLRLEIAGTLAGAWWDSEEPNTLHFGHRGKPNEVLVRDPGLMDASVRPFADYPGGHAEGFPDTFKQLYRAIYADIAAGHRSAAPLYATFADGDREVRLCEAILRSHRERCWIAV